MSDPQPVRWTERLAKIGFDPMGSRRRDRPMYALSSFRSPKHIECLGFPPGTGVEPLISGEVLTSLDSLAGSGA